MGSEFRLPRRATVGLSLISITSGASTRITIVGTAPMAYAVRTADGEEPRDINPNSPKYRARIAVWQKLPLPIANLIGPWIARGLG